MATKTLDQKLKAIKANPGGNDFILADAKDADMAFGVGAPGLSPEMHAGQTRFRSIQEYRDIIRQIVKEKLVDIMLMSASTSEILTIRERLFDDSPVTPAARANDAFDVHVVRGGRYIDQSPRPFSTATLDHIQCGRHSCDEEERKLGANLGLYSVTFTNDTEQDLYTLERFKAFRHEAELKGFRYFLEVFNPNLKDAVAPGDEASFLNDMIARCLAGVTQRGRPVFLKIVYNGPRAMEELCRYDSDLVVGVLGGSAGTTYDAFKLLSEAKKYGARAALFGRKINQAENQFAFIRFLRLIADGQISAEEAVHAYHGVLERLGVRPHRSLENDLRLETAVMRYLTTKETVLMPSSASYASSTPDSAPRSSHSPAAASKEVNGSSAASGVRITLSHTASPTTFDAVNGHGSASAARTVPVTPAVPASTASAPTPSPTQAQTGANNVKTDGCGTKGKCHCGCKKNQSPWPNWSAMSNEERLKYHRQRIAALFGER